MRILEEEEYNKILQSSWTQEEVETVNIKFTGDIDKLNEAIENIEESIIDMYGKR
tara:strand:+ start:466 stop:630 length:165 start_codon:yes stop_codon:yes gene_type:complete